MSTIPSVPASQLLRFHRVLHDPATEQSFVAALQSPRWRCAYPTREVACAANFALYFGGGTPTTLSEQSWRRIFATVSNYFSLVKPRTNYRRLIPNQRPREKPQLLRELGVNQVSFGAQSFSPTNLERLVPIHNVEQIVSAVQNARQADIANVA